jgi:ribonuclease Z
VEPPDTYVIPLGVAPALPDAARANTYLAVVCDNRYWLVDCADSPLGRLQQAGLDPLDVQGVIITHFHPDHVYGLPAYLMGLYLLGLEQGRPIHTSLHLYARAEVLGLVQAMIGLYQIQNWTEMFRVEYHVILPEIGAPVVEDKDFVISSAPTHHSVPSIAVRFVCKENGRGFVYSSDTSPCPEVESLAWGSVLLFHEASGAGYGHTSAADAGALAARADVERLVLIHYPYGHDERLLAEARTTFHGQVELAREFGHYPW